MLSNRGEFAHAVCLRSSKITNHAGPWRHTMAVWFVVGWQIALCSSRCVCLRMTTSSSWHCICEILSFWRCFRFNDCSSIGHTIWVWQDIGESHDASNWIRRPIFVMASIKSKCTMVHSLRIPWPELPRFHEVARDCCKDPSDGLHVLEVHEDFGIEIDSGEFWLKCKHLTRCAISASFKLTVCELRKGRVRWTQIPKCHVALIATIRVELTTPTSFQFVGVGKFESLIFASLASPLVRTFVAWSGELDVCRPCTTICLNCPVDAA